TTLGGEPVELTGDPAGPLAALVFKTLSDPFTGKISILRVVSGTLHSDSTVYNCRTEENERLGNLLALQGKTGSAVPRLVAGDIGGVAKLKATATGDTLTSRERPLRLGWIEIAEPAMAFAVEPKAKGDEEKIGEALARLMGTAVKRSSPAAAASSPTARSPSSRCRAARSSPSSTRSSAAPSRRTSARRSRRASRRRAAAVSWPATRWSIS